MFNNGGWASLPSCLASTLTLLSPSAHLSFLSLSLSLSLSHSLCLSHSHSLLLFLSHSFCHFILCFLSWLLLFSRRLSNPMCWDLFPPLRLVLSQGHESFKKESGQKEAVPLLVACLWSPPHVLHQISLSLSHSLPICVFSLCFSCLAAASSCLALCWFLFRPLFLILCPSPSPPFTIPNSILYFSSLILPMPFNLSASARFCMGRVNGLDEGDDMGGVSCINLCVYVCEGKCVCSWLQREIQASHTHCHTASAIGHSVCV